MIHPDTELKFISHEIGYGVVAKKLIPKGTVTWAMDKLDRIFLPEEIVAMDPLYHDILDTYTFRDSSGNHVLCWDNGRYVNHSFHPTCITTAYNFELAVRDIYPGEELTDDYGFLNVTEPFHCLPEKRSARTVVNPDDLLHYHSKWDKKLISAFRRFSKVEQPLKKFLDPDTVRIAEDIACGKNEMESILNCYCAKPSVLKSLPS